MDDVEGYGEDKEEDEEEEYNYEIFHISVFSLRHGDTLVRNSAVIILESATKKHSKHYGCLNSIKKIHQPVHKYHVDHLMHLPSRSKL